MSLKFEQFVKFSTDSVGLERTFRLFQATVQILSFFTLPFDLLLQALALSSGTRPSPAAVLGILKGLNQRLGLARRYFRVFRFLDSFSAAQKLSSKLSSAGGGPRPWLDVFARTFMGLYLLLEASTLVDAMQVPGLSVWAAERERGLTVEAQRFWLFSLVCGALHNLLEIRATLASASEKEATVDEKAKDAKKLEKEQKEKERLRKQEVATKVYKLGRGAVANALDIVLPGTVVGWVKLEPGYVGLAMFVTTILTGMDVWERCGREVAGSK